MVNQRRGPVDAGARQVSSGSVFSTILITDAIEACGAPVGGRVLDVGCGGSPYRDLLGPDIYLGVDRTPHTRQGDPSATADVAALPIRTATMDAVMCTEVIEHVPDERALVAELARVARPGALLVLSSPFVHGLHEMPYDFRRLTSIGLVRVLEESGWELESVRSIGGPLVVTGDTFARWLNHVLRAAASRIGRLSSGLAAGVTSLSPALQVAMATILRRLPRQHLGPMDPMSPHPRLTLGYVVVARRRSTDTTSG